MQTVLCQQKGFSAGELERRSSAEAASEAA
jgi:hypothetical protein